jgi:hypothetical protein
VYYGVSFSSVDIGGNRYLNVFLVSVVEIPSNFAYIWSAHRWVKEWSNIQYLKMCKLSLYGRHLLKISSLCEENILHSFKVPISLVGPLWIWKERKKLVNKFKRFFWFSAIISKIQASKLPTVPESQAPMHNGQFGKKANSIAVFRAQEAGTQEQFVV